MKLRRYIIAIAATLGLLTAGSGVALASGTPSDNSVPATAAVGQVCGWQTLPTSLSFGSFAAGTNSQPQPEAFSIYGNDSYSLDLAMTPGIPETNAGNPVTTADYAMSASNPNLARSPYGIAAGSMWIAVSQSPQGSSDAILNMDGEGVPYGQGVTGDSSLNNNLAGPNFPAWSVLQAPQGAIVTPLANAAQAASGTGSIPLDGQQALGPDNSSWATEPAPTTGIDAYGFNLLLSVPVAQTASNTYAGTATFELDCQ